MLYPAKKDAWAAGLLLIIASIMLALAALVWYGVLTGFIPNLTLSLIPMFVPLVFGIVLLWILFGTSYEITASALLIRYGPIRRQMPLERIVEVVQTSKFFHRPGWGFALSLDRLEIIYRKTNGKISRLPVAISPQDKSGFVRELMGAVPGLQVQEVT